MSIAMRNDNAHLASAVLLWLTITEYAVLVALTGWRLIAYRAAMAGDFVDTRRAFGFFTFVAGTDVLGTRLAVSGHEPVALALLVAGWLG